MKNSIKIVSFIMATTILISLLMTIYSSAAVSNTNEEKIYCNAKIGDEFADDTVLVIIKNAISIKCDTYTINDFTEIKPSSVEHLSSALETRVKRAFDNVLYSVTNGVQARIDESLNIGKFNQVLSIKLSEIGKDKVLAAIEVLEKYDDILYVGPDYYWTYCGDTSNSEVYLQDFSEQWAYTQIQLDDAWDYINSLNLPDTTIRIGVIDSGINASHQALQTSINTNDSGTYGDDTIRGATVDGYDHGTPVAGIIKGVAKNVELISFKVSESSPVLSSSVYEAIISLNEFEESIPIINFSIAWKTNEGVSTSTNYDMVIESALTQYNGLIVGAADNNGVSEGVGADIDYDTNHDFYPSQHEISNMIVVGASTRLDGIRADSNYGELSVDVFAPGVDIYTTTSSGGYTSSQGMTSMATPFVTGLAAMLLMVNQDLTPEMIIDIIKTTADTVNDSNNPNNGDNIDELEDACTSGGRINAFEAVQAAIDYDTTHCTHSNASYTYTADTHTLTCPICSYTLTEAHNFLNNTYNVNTHTLTCSVCSYTLTEAHNDFSYTYNAYTHSLKCSDCSYITGNAVHDGSYVTYDLNTHTFSCSVCPYTLSSSHELYVYSDNGEAGVTIKCYQCDYMWYCNNGVAVYGNAGQSGHYISCTCGCYNILAPHFPRIIMQTSSLYTHDAVCRDCGGYYQAAHSWVPAMFGYECAMCSMYSAYIPGIMQIPPVDELLIASNDTPVAEEALLPQKEEDLVTE